MVEREFIKNLKVFGYYYSDLINFSMPSSVFFFKYCNMDCHYCHNKKNMLESEAFNSEELKYNINLTLKSKLIEGIVLTGGEPTLYGYDLLLFCKYIRDNAPHKKIKLDTNGTKPTVLQELIDNKLVDTFAMDIKGKFENYHKYGYKDDTDNLYKAAEILDKFQHVNYRCTLNKLIDNDDLTFISKNFPDCKFQKENNIIE